MLAFGLQALVSLVLSIVAKYLEKPRNLNDFLRLGAENLSILATFRRVLDGIDLNDSPTTITKKVVVQIKEDFKDTILPAAQKHDQHGQGRIVTDDVGERATSIAQNIASRIVEQIKDNLKASVKSTISKTRKECWGCHRHFLRRRSGGGKGSSGGRSFAFKRGHEVSKEATVNMQYLVDGKRCSDNHRYLSTTDGRIH